MLLGILGDTHDNMPMIRRALLVLADAGADALIHTGDFVAPFALKEILKFEGPVYAVFGNNDGEHAGLKKLLPDLEVGPRRIELCEKKIIIVHDETTLTKRDIAESDLVVIGHTHSAEIRRGAPLVVDPGECGGWLKGKSTIATVDTETLEAKIIELGGTCQET